MLIFTFFLLEFAWRFFNDRPVVHKKFAVTVFESTPEETKDARWLIVGVSVSNILIFVRSVFRA